MSANTKWSFEADFLQACNCDYGCPCEFSAPPTNGGCEGMVAWRINRGNYGSVKLDGVGLGFAVDLVDGDVEAEADELERFERVAAILFGDLLEGFFDDFVHGHGWYYRERSGGK